jgi:hypothetical protein
VLFLRAVLVLPLITLFLRLRGFRYAQRILQRFLGPGKKSPQEMAPEPLLALTSRMVLAAARHSPIRSTCLERSLCLWWLLARQSIATQFRIGVRKDGSKFTAHAWVERDGIAIGEPEAPHSHYAAFSEEMSGDVS